MGSSEIFAPDVLAGTVAVITGGGTGLGRAAAAELLACGARVVICGRRAEVLDEAVEGFDSPDVRALTADIRDPADARRVIQTALDEFGRVDVLVNNAGGQYFVPAEKIAQKGWNAVWRLNVGATMTMTRAALALASPSTILNVTLSPHHGLPGMTHSSAARAAVEGLTAELAVELEPRGVSVIAIAAGHFETDAMRKYPESLRLGAGLTVPLGRLGQEPEHGWLVALLATPLGALFNGSVVTLDGARDNWYGPWPPPDITVDGQVPTEARKPSLG
ncbi:MAG TPA: SDR family NAD(P)-dependent oxidoreductase [Solirubrobacteraceae bacterium]|nr:SDR family NAD(P)-dependent oxidoreductase [Solirubrobacteraceae bacterium]